MIKRYIGIDISSSYLCAVQLLQKGQQLVIEKVAGRLIRRNTDSVPDMINTIISQGDFDRHAEIAAALPNSSIFFRNIETNSAINDKHGSLNISVLENSFPIESDEIIAQICSCRRLSSDKYSTLVAAASKTALNERLSLFKQANIAPVLVDAAILAVCATTRVNHPEVCTGLAIIAYIDESYLSLAITQNGNILIVRSIPVVFNSQRDTDSLGPQLAELLSREVEITFKKVLGDEDIEQSCRIYVASIGKTSSDFKTVIENKMNCQVVEVNPYAKVTANIPQTDNIPIYTAEGLALRLSVPDKIAGVNFMESADRNVKPAINLKKELIIYAILAAAVILVSLGGLFVRLFVLESRYTGIKNEMREIYQKAFPGETNVINPLAQLDQKLQSLQKEYLAFSPVSETGLGPLEILYAVSTTASESAINIDNMLIASESVRLTGMSSSFESVYSWQQALQRLKGFSSVDVKNIGRDSKSQQVNFTILISLGTSEPK